MTVELMIGWDERERITWQVCARSLLKHARVPPPIRPISTVHLGALYRRPTEIRNGRLFDVQSNAFCSTMFSFARFWAPRLCSAQWAIFVDGDFLFRADIGELIALLDPRYSVMCVQHDFRPAAHTKMDGQVQTTYDRKCWTSLIAFNCQRAAVKRLDEHALNERTALHLHRLEWCKDNEIGALPAEWHHIPGHSSEPDPKAVHLTHGTPELGYDSPWSREWWSHAP